MEKNLSAHLPWIKFLSYHKGMNMNFQQKQKLKQRSILKAQSKIQLSKSNPANNWLAAQRIHLSMQIWWSRCKENYNLIKSIALLLIRSMSIKSSKNLEQGISLTSRLQKLWSWSWTTWLNLRMRQIERIVWRSSTNKAMPTKICNCRIILGKNGQKLNINHFLLTRSI